MLCGLSKEKRVASWVRHAARRKTGPGGIGGSLHNDGGDFVYVFR